MVVYMDPLRILQAFIQTVRGGRLQGARLWDSGSGFEVSGVYAFCELALRV